MTNLNDLSAPQAGASTVLDERLHNDEPQPIEGMDAPEEKAGSTRDAIAKAFDEVAGKEEPAEDEPKAEEKPTKAEKPEPKEPVKAEEKASKAEEPKDQPEKGEKSAAPEKDDATGQDGAEKSRQSEGRNHHEPPARFLPKAKEVWANTPNPVKAEVARMAQEFEQEVSQYRESHENWQKLAKYDEMAKQHNVTVADAMERYTAVDALLHSNPVEGIRQVLATVGITPQQYAEYVMKNPHASQPPPQRAPDPAVQRTSSEVEALKQEIAAMRREQAARSIIDPFRATHPRYDELQDDIALFLSSEKIPQSLSPSERLEAAYDMAERINPRSMPAAPEPSYASPASDPEPVVDPRGQKSIKGAPSAGFKPSETGSVKSRRDAVKTAMAEHGLL